MGAASQPKLDLEIAAPDLSKTIMANGSLRFHKTIRIAVSGDVRLTQAECAIIDCDDFQRLRRVRQLGASHYVYPTALHTRFDHSLGVLHELDQLILKINDNVDQGHSVSEPVQITPRQRIVARLYALLHDITHVPFGHTLEDELGIFPSHDEFQKNETSDSSRFERALGTSSAIGKLVVKFYGTDVYERFRNVFLSGGRKTIPVKEGDTIVSDEVLYFLVSDTVCADLLDYVKRDTHFANLNVNISDRILNYLYVSKPNSKIESNEVKRENSGKTVPVIRLWKKNEDRARADLLTDLTNLLEARYMIGERVYFHPAKIIIDAMVGRSVYEAVRNDKLKSIDMMDYSDDTLLDFLSKLPGQKLEVGRKLAKEILSRHLYKRIFKYGEAEFHHGKDRSDLADRALRALKSPEMRTKVEDDISHWAGGKPGEVLIFPPSRKMNSKVAQVMVDWHDEQIPLSDIDDVIVGPRLSLLKESHKRLWGIHLLASPNFDADQLVSARRAFEGYFLGKNHGIDAFEHLFREKVDGIPTMSNRPPAARKAVSRHAAARFVEKSISFHGQAAEKIEVVIQNYIDQAIDEVLVDK